MLSQVHSDLVLIKIGQKKILNIFKFNIMTNIIYHFRLSFVIYEYIIFFRLGLRFTSYSALKMHIKINIKSLIINYTRMERYNKTKFYFIIR